MARTDDDDFMFLNEEQNEVEDIPEVLAANLREIRVNGKGQKVRGKDLEWIPRSSFSSNETFKESEIYKDLRAGFTLKRKGDSEAGFTETYICRYSRRMGYVRCPKVFRVVYSSDSYDVHVEETSGEHDHSEDPDSVSRSGVYHWSQLATQIVTEGVSNNLKPTVILRNLRARGALSDPEPTRIQLNNKISHVKKKGNLNEPCNTTHDLRNKLKDFLENPLLDDESWVPLSEIDDSGEGQVRITIIFGTNKTLENLKFSETFHCDATYRLTWNRYPVFVCGVTNETGKFFPCFAVLSSHEDSLSWRKVFEFVHSYNGGTHFKYFMGDGAKSITKAWSEVTFTFSFISKYLYL